MSILLPQVYTAYEVSSLTIEDWLPAGLEALDPNLDNFNGGCGGGCGGCGCGCGGGGGGGGGGSGAPWPFGGCVAGGAARRSQTQ